VGRALAAAWQRAGASLELTHFTHAAPGSRPLDIRDGEATARLVSSSKPDLVALPAANPYVDDCERHPEENRRINVEGTRNVARACAAAGARLLFFSTDYVFDGRKGSDYEEGDAPNPINEYGRQKLAAEGIVGGSSGGNLIVRSSAVYGWHEAPKNFVLQILDRLKKGQTVKAATDILYNPTNADNLAQVCVRLADVGARGVYHVAGSERMSRFDFARHVAAAFGFDPGAVVPARSAEFGQPAARPALSSLSSARAARETGCELWGVARGLEEMRRGEDAWRRRWTGVSPAA